MKPQVQSPPPRITDTKDYASILRLRNLKYKEVDQYYLQVGTIKKTQGWIIHISSIAAQTAKLFQCIIPELIKERVPFKIIRDEKHAHLLLDARLGYAQVGKIISIYPENENLADDIAQRLVQLTQSFKGPAIPTDAYLGGTVYTRYGSFNPIMITGENGQTEKHMYDHKGNIIKDPYTIPFAVPPGTFWPFKKSPLPTNEKLHILNNTYLVTSELKGDVKGRVLKAIRVKGWTIKRAVVKEARHDQSVDVHGRDIMHRLSWQYEVQKKLCSSIALPKVFEFFKQDGNCYFGMEYVKGVPLLKFLNQTFEGVAWKNLPLQKQIQILTYLLQVLDIIDEMHKMGYVHRDISPANFLIGKRGIIIIDLEGAYSLVENAPQPPYIVGTQGFTPPEQEDAANASIKGDIYSLGALMFTFFTGLMPGKFLTDHRNRVEENLESFDIDQPIHDLIEQCLCLTPEDRPDLSILQNSISEYQTKIKQNITKRKQDVTTGNVSRSAGIKKDNIGAILSKSINTYGSTLFAEATGLWHTNFIEQDRLIMNRHVIKDVNPGLFSGVSGGLYIIARAKAAGLHSQKISSAYNLNYKMVHQTVVSKSNKIPVGLYFGKAGMAVAIANSVASKLVADNPKQREAILQSFDIVDNDFTISSGTAGQCLAILQCREYLTPSITKKILNGHVNMLLEQQQNNGSWNLPSGIQYTGIEHGIAGIALALLHCYEYNPSPEIKRAVLKAFSWLDGQYLKREGMRLWRTCREENSIDPWFNNGIAGIALCYLFADKIFNDSNFRTIAQVPLNYLTNHLVQSNLSLANGLSGLGEVYLEANTILDTDHYQPNIDRIAEIILKSRYDKSGLNHWLASDEKEPDGSFMTGNGGIIHYLLRYQNPKSLAFPLFGIVDPPKVNQNITNF